MERAHADSNCLYRAGVTMHGKLQIRELINHMALLAYHLTRLKKQQNANLLAVLLAI